MNIHPHLYFKAFPFLREPLRVLTNFHPHYGNDSSHSRALTEVCPMHRRSYEEGARARSQLSTNTH